MKLSIIIPCYNEDKTIGELLRRVLAADLGPVDKDIIVVDDASSDRSAEIVREIERRHSGMVRLLVQPENRGKGAAVRRGLEAAQGELVVIQDADLEYDPRDFRPMLALFDGPDVTVVFGSRRLLPGNPISGLWEYLGAQVINAFTNMLYGARITDQFTCYKMFRRELIPQLKLRTAGFEFDAELTAKLLRLGQRVREVPIHYAPRSRAQGKKIRWRDGVAWLWQIIKHRFTRREYW
jgi:dolichol-phosphate mannosyltransferase